MPTPFPDQIYIGKYHDVDCEKYIIDPETTEFNWYDFCLGDEYDPNTYATECGEDYDVSCAEMVAIIVRFGQDYNGVQHVKGGIYTIECRKKKDDRLLWKLEFKVHDPEDCGFAYWYGSPIVTWVGKGFTHAGCTQDNPCLITDYSNPTPCEPENGYYYPYDYWKVWWYDKEIDEPGEYYWKTTSPYTTRTVDFKVVATQATPVFSVNDCILHNVTKGTSVKANEYYLKADYGDFLRFDYKVNEVGGYPGPCKVAIFDKGYSLDTPLDWAEFNLSANGSYTGNLLGSKTKKLYGSPYGANGLGWWNDFYGQRLYLSGKISEISFWLARAVEYGEPDGDIYFDIYDKSGGVVFSQKWGTAQDIESADAWNPSKCTLTVPVDLILNPGYYYVGVRRANGTEDTWVWYPYLKNQSEDEGEYMVETTYFYLVEANGEPADSIYEIKLDNVVYSNTMDLIAKTYYKSDTGWELSDEVGL